MLKIPRDTLQVDAKRGALRETGGGGKEEEEKVGGVSRSGGRGAEGKGVNFNMSFLKLSFDN